MGHQTEAKCIDCGEVFSVDHGGGFFFHLVRCDKCGMTESIDFDQLGELHHQYLKGLTGPYCIASSEHDKNIQENEHVKPISEEEYHQGIDAIAGKCKCGGQYSLSAPSRCPKCYSTRIEEGDISVMYD